MFKLNLQSITILLLSVALWPTLAFSKPKAEVIAAFDKMVKYQAQRLKVPGWAFGLVIDGDTVLKTVEGPVNSQTLFQIGSIAKSFAATIAVKFQLQNKLQLEQPIKTYLPNRCHQKQCDGITIAQLLSHTSGIPAAEINKSIESGNSYESTLSKALNAKKTCTPGTCFQYNNAAYELVREILEKTESRSYAEIMKKELLTPLKLNKTTTTFEDLKRSNNYFSPHLFQNGRFLETTHSTAYYQYPGSSLLNSNLDDMLRFLSAELGYAPETVPPEALKILHKPTTQAPDAYAWFEKPLPGKEMSSQYAIGHRVLMSPDLTVVFHPGWIRGCKSLMAIFPERKIGFVLLQNSGSQFGFRVLEDVVRYLRTGQVK